MFVSLTALSIFSWVSSDTIPTNLCLRPGAVNRELLKPTLMDSKADVYAWASVAYEVRTVHYDFDTIISTCILMVLSGKQPYHGYHHCRGIVKRVTAHSGGRGR